VSFFWDKVYIRYVSSGSMTIPCRCAKYCDERVCMSVCVRPLAYLKNNGYKLHKIFY